jgi:hypothetical protein
MSFSLRVPQTLVTEKNHRLTIDAGSKIASLLAVQHEGRRDFMSNDYRTTLQAGAVAAVIRLYEDAHGPVAWDLATVTFSHVTVGCAVELRVAPE